MTNSGEKQATADTEDVSRPRLRLDGFLPHQLSVLSNTVSRAIAGAYAERFGLSIPEWRVIAVLQYFPEASSGELSEKTGMDSVAVSRAVNSLARAGLITRRACENDRRRIVLDLSEQGRDVYDEITPVALEYDAKLLARLSNSERRQLNALLKKLAEQAQKLELP